MKLATSICFVLLFLISLALLIRSLLAEWDKIVVCRFTFFISRNIMLDDLIIFYKLRKKNIHPKQQ